MVADGLEKAPASCSSFTADSLGLVTFVNEKDHTNTLVGSSQVDVDPEQPNAASGDQAVQNKIEADELLNSIPSHANCPGHAPDLVVNNQPNSTGYQVIQNPLMTGTHTPGFCSPDNISMAVTANPSYCWHDPGSSLGMSSDSGKLEDQAQSVAVVLSCGDHHLEDKHIEWHHDSYVEVLRREISAAGIGSPGAGAAPIPHKPITDAGWLDALGILNCHEEDVSSALSSSVHGAPSYPQGGDLR